MDLIEIAKQAHRSCCPMINCVDCLFGVCDSDCDYQVNFEKELMELINYGEGNDNKRTMHQM